MPESNPKASAIIATEQIALAVKAVEGASCAVVDLVPDVAFDKVNGLEIYVLPDGAVRNITTRAVTDSTLRVGVAILKKCKNKSEIPALLLLEETIAKALERKRLTGSGVVVRVETDPLYSPDLFVQRRLFFALLIVSVKGGDE